MLLCRLEVVVQPVSKRQSVVGLRTVLIEGYSLFGMLKRVLGLISFVANKRQIDVQNQSIFNDHLSLLFTQRFFQLFWHIDKLSQASLIESLSVGQRSIFRVSNEFLANLSDSLEVLDFALEGLWVFENWSSLDVCDVQSQINIWTELMACHQMLFFAVSVVDVFVMLFSDLEPNHISFAHGEESSPDVFVAFSVGHFKFVGNSAPLVEVNKLPIVESCAMHVVYGIGRLHASLVILFRSLHSVLHQATILVCRQIDRLLALDLNLAKIIKLIFWPFVLFFNIMGPSLFFSSALSLVFCLLLQGLKNGFDLLSKLTISNLGVRPRKLTHHVK